MDLRDKIMQFSEKKEVKKIETKELGDVFIIKLDTKTGTEISKALHTDADIIAKSMIASLSDEDGKLLFKKSDLEHLNSLPIEFTSEIFEQILIFNKMMPSDEVEEAKN